jgi:hypothetical protein
MTGPAEPAGGLALDRMEDDGRHGGITEPVEVAVGSPVDLGRPRSVAEQILDHRPALSHECGPKTPLRQDLYRHAPTLLT